jgi:predicted ATPase
MEIKSFRVENFRSIIDTGWQFLSVDDITVLVGQNESGKSSILDALELGYAINHKINPDDFRYASDLPRISLRCTLSEADIEAISLTQPDEFRQGLQQLLLAHSKDVVIVSRVVQEKAGLVVNVSFSEELMLLVAPLLAPSSVGVAAGDDLEDVDYKENFLEELWRHIPEFLQFNEQTCSLPNRIDIVDGELVRNSGTRGAKNFISASGLDLSAVISSDLRQREVALRKASSSITRNLQEFWTQVLGKSDQISLVCELENYPVSEVAKAGQPYLVFWVREGDHPLFPSQRSRGTKWFISFFLELLASNKRNPGRVILLDEPANFLHPAAQKDVLRLLEKLAKTTKIIYSTHSPYMLDHQRLHRVLAVEREQGVADESEALTVVRRGLDLASASKLTLAPILGLIGVDLTQQQIIKKKRNVILEEISALYYIRAWSKLFGIDDDFYLVACGGVDAVKTMVDLFIAWGIKFTVLVDDDSHGKRVVRDIKARYHLSDDEAKDILLTIEGCEGIEDVFSPSDFSRFILKADGGFDGKNSTYVKKGFSKPLLALNFSEAVRKGDIHIEDFSQETVARAKSLIFQLCKSIADH